MKILFFVPHLNTIYAGRTIYTGYKNAFQSLGHDFRFLTALDDQKQVLEAYEPDILFTGFNFYVLKFLNIDAVKKQKQQRKLKVFVSAPFWNSPLAKTRINEAKDLSSDSDLLALIKSGFGDLYYNVCETGDERMDGFEKATGYKHYTIPLAADNTLNYYEYNENYKTDISFLGTNLPEKRAFFRETILPLTKEYNIKFYGQDWTAFDKALGYAQKIGQYFNIPGLRSVQKPKLALEEERYIYSSTSISLNVHEVYQRKFGGDCNERTFKIPACSGFEIVDDVSCIRKYFNEGTEIVIAKNKKDWEDKLDYYLKHPDKRAEIVKAGLARVLNEHTYQHRVATLLKLYKTLN